MQNPDDKGMQQCSAAPSQSLYWICQQFTVPQYQQAEKCQEYFIPPISSRCFYMSETNLVYDKII